MAPGCTCCCSSRGPRLDYSINGRRKTLSLGTYPDTGLSLARRKAEEARRLVGAGIAPDVLACLRRIEAWSAVWYEFDLDAATWLIPAARMKRNRQGKASGVPHLVPLSVQAVAILQELQRLTGTGRLLFPGMRSKERRPAPAGLRRRLEHRPWPARQRPDDAG